MIAAAAIFAAAWIAGAPFAAFALSGTFAAAALRAAFEGMPQ